MIAARSDEGDVMRRQNIGKTSILRQEPIARMHGVGAGDFASRDDRGNVEIAFAGRRGAYADAFIGKTHMHGVSIGGDRKSTRLNSSHSCEYRMPSSA